MKSSHRLAVALYYLLIALFVVSTGALAKMAYLVLLGRIA